MVEPCQRGIESSTFIKCGDFFLAFELLTASEYILYTIELVGPCLGRLILLKFDFGVKYKLPFNGEAKNDSA